MNIQSIKMIEPIDVSSKTSGLAVEPRVVNVAPNTIPRQTALPRDMYQATIKDVEIKRQHYLLQLAEKLYNIFPGGGFR